MRDPRDHFPPLIPGICDEPTCCGPVTRKSKKTRQLARFCSPECSKRNHARALKRGIRIYEVAMRWRGAKRSHQRGAENPPSGFTDLTGLLDEFRAEDREMRERTGRTRMARTAPKVH